MVSERVLVHTAAYDPETKGTFVIEDHGVVKSHVRRARPRAGAEQRSDGAVRARTTPAVMAGVMCEAANQSRTNDSSDIGKQRASSVG